MPDEKLAASQKAMAFEGLVRNLMEPHKRDDEIAYLTKALHLQLPPEPTIRQRRITLTETVKEMENPEGTRKLCDLFQHFPKREEEKERDSGQKLRLEGNVLGQPASLEFAPARVALKLPKPVNTTDQTAVEMVKGSLAFVDQWTTFTSQLRDPQNGVQLDAFQEMLASAYILEERRGFKIPDKDMDLMVTRFEQACQRVGISNTEAALVMTGSILRQYKEKISGNNLNFNRETSKVDELHHPNLGANEYFSYNKAGFEEYMKMVKHMFRTNYEGKGHTVWYAPFLLFWTA